MAWTLTYRTDNSNGATGTQTLTTPSFTPANNSLLCHFAYMGADNHSTAANAALANTGGWTYTRQIQTATATWNGDALYRGCAAFWTAPVTTGAAMTATVDPWTTTNNGFMSQVAFDIVQSSGAFELAQAVVGNCEQDGGGNSETHTTASLGVAATTGNLCVLCVGASGDAAGAITAPAGWTAPLNQTQTYTHISLYHRTDFTGTSVSISDLGQTVGVSASVLMEFRLTPTSTNNPKFFRLMGA
jgi:hypothetical protein